MSRHIFDEVIEFCPQVLTDLGFRVIEKSQPPDDGYLCSYVTLENDPIVVTFSRDRGAIAGEVASNLEPKEKYPFFLIAGLLGKNHRRLRGDDCKPHSVEGPEKLAFVVNFLLSN